MATSRIWVASRGIAAIGARRLRQAGAAPTSANPTPPRGLTLGRLFVGGPLHDDLAGVEASGRGTRPAAGPLSSRGGSRYHAERSTAGCWVPPRQLPITGVRAGRGCTAAGPASR